MIATLEAAYSETHRHYHDRRHIQQCLALLDEVPELMESERRVLTWAIWWHDAIYDPRASDNEARSAELAKRELRDLDATLHERDEVARLIRLTAGHEVEAEDRLGEILVSIDLSILGAPPETYDAYVAGVRAEYAHVPDEAWQAGRLKVLAGFLDRSAIFPDPDMRGHFEAAARMNITREIAALLPPAG